MKSSLFDHVPRSGNCTFCFWNGHTNPNCLVILLLCFWGNFYETRLEMDQKVWNWKMKRILTDYIVTTNLSDRCRYENTNITSHKIKRSKSKDDILLQTTLNYQTTTKLILMNSSVQPFDSTRVSFTDCNFAIFACTIYQHLDQKMIIRKIHQLRRSVSFDFSVAVVVSSWDN